MSVDNPRPARALPERSSVGVSGSASDEARELAQFFHETYERLAPQFGYETRVESAVPWSEVPDNNRRLMEAVCADLLAGDSPLSERLVGLSADVSRLTAEKAKAEEAARVATALWEGASDACGELRARVAVLREALEQIADPSYIGNYELFDVVEIYRKWAKNALEASLRDAGEAKT